MTIDEQFMLEAFKEAEKSALNGGDPFGAILVKDGQIVARSHDKSIELIDPTAHAELSLISEYTRQNKTISLEGFTVYATTEPCLMCCGAIHWAKISRLVFSVSQDDLKKFSQGNRKLGSQELLNQGTKKIEIVPGVLREKGLRLLQEFPLISKAQRLIRMEREE